jgi:choline kinase
MRGIILAAGGGTRLRPLTDHVPKCLVSVNGTPIVENALAALQQAGCSSVSIVSGYLADVLQRRVGTRHHGMPIDYILNEEWQATNSMYSLHLALERGSAQFVIEGDVYFEPDLLRHPVLPDICWIVDGTYRASDGAYIQRDNDGCVSDLKIVKRPDELTPEWAKSVGMLLLSERGSVRLRDWLKAAVSEQKRNLYYDLIIAEHLEERVVRSLDIAPRRWWEIDTPEDLANAERLFS